MDSSPTTSRRWTAFRVTVFVECLVLLVFGCLAGLRPIVAKVSPDGARKQAVRRLERRDYRRGLDALARYAQRFPQQAAKAETLKIGDPVRLVVEFRADGLLLTSPVLPLTAAAYADAATEKRTPTQAAVADGPMWLGGERLAWLAQEREQPPQIVVLNAADRDLKAIPPPATPHFTLSFAAAVALATREDGAKVAAIRPNFGGATNPRLLALSPDGSWLIFAVRAAGEHPYELWRARPDGSDAARLAVPETPCQAVSFAPDGSRLAWFDGPRVMTAGLADTAGRELKSYELAAVLQPQAPCWSPDGRELAYGVGSSDAWRLFTCPVDQPEKAAERPRLNFIETLQYAGPSRLLQTQKERDKDHRLISLRCTEDAFNSRLLVDNALNAALSGDGRRLAFRTNVAVKVLWLFQPLGERPTAALPAATLPERPGGPPAPVSPKPRVVAPKPPSVQT